jgi:hypothetical protein
MPSKFFLGASVLTAALLLPHAPSGPVLLGIALAGLLQTLWLLIAHNNENDRR